jgi:hypothetical protein
MGNDGLRITNERNTIRTAGLHEEDATFEHSVGQKQFSRETTKCKLKGKSYSRHYQTPALWRRTLRAVDKQITQT